METLTALMLATCSRLGTNLVAGDAKPGVWQPADDSGPGVARVRLFFHCVTFTDE